MSTPEPTTKQRIVDATFEALRTKGFSGASARAIAGIAKVNPGLLFYYFDTLDDLLVEALRQSSEERLARHRATLGGASSLTELLALLREIYREDRESGHITVVSEMVAGSVARPPLGARVMELTEPWIDLAEEGVEQALAGSPLAALAPPRELALAGVTFYLGANLVTHLSDGAESVDGLLASAERAAALFSP
ncbi:MAG: TetR/AcrR family transcriptional regulator [Thermoleophilaceae bacterium]